jgi:hypothetical protein
MDKLPDLKLTGDELADISSRLDDLRTDAVCIKVDPTVMRRLLADHRALLTYHRAYTK